MGKRKSSKDDTVINWQPISALPTIAFIINEMLNETQEQYETLLEAREKPHVLDDYTVDRVHSAYTTQLEDVSLFDEQLARWEKGQLDSNQRQEVEKLTKQAEELRKVCQQILSLAAELKKGTINRILEKSDLELAMDVLTGKLKLPKK
jgi:hypothetical protein